MCFHVEYTPHLALEGLIKNQSNVSAWLHEKNIKFLDKDFPRRNYNLTHIPHHTSHQSTILIQKI